MINLTKRNVTLDGETLNTFDVADVAYGHATVIIADNAMMRVHMARNVVDRIVEGDETVMELILVLDRSYIQKSAR